MKKILVTGIGGGVGQGIVRNIRNLSLDIEIIGTNTEMVSSGNYLCNKVYQVPFAYTDNYLPEIKKILIAHGIDIVIPSTDYESFYLGKYKDELPCHIACSPFYTTGFCLDKYLNYQEFYKHNIPFATSIIPSKYADQFENCIVKPREGRGSRDIEINPPFPKQFDETFVVQEYLNGPEITTTAYIDKQNNLHGIITFLRELEHGNTSKCEVVFAYDTELTALVNKIIQHFEFVGSFNIQSRVTDKGIIPFEINCRISGTNSIRSQFGFNDVEFTLREYLFNQPLPKPKVQKGSALRVMLDVIYPNISLKDISDCDDNFYIN